MNLYTVVKTPDGRTGIYHGSFYAGAASPEKESYDQVLFDDQSEWRFPCDSLKRAGIKLGYDPERRGFKAGDPYWQAVLRRHFAIGEVIQSLSHLKLGIERQMEPDCWNDEEGLWGAVMVGWTRRYGPSLYPAWAIRYAWRLLFRDDLPENMEEIAAVYEPDAERRWKRYFQEEEKERALTGSGPPVQHGLPGLE